MKPYAKLLLGVPLFWFPMSFIHEIGHCISVVINGGVVDGLYWRYGVFSETVRSGSSQPRLDIWAGPIIGCVIPVMIWICFIKYAFCRYIQWFASICLLGNGLYLGLGWMDQGTDSYDLMILGTNLIPIIGIGLLFSIIGLFLMIWEKPPANKSLHGSGPQ